MKTIWANKEREQLFITLPHFRKHPDYPQGRKGNQLKAYERSQCANMYTAAVRCKIYGIGLTECLFRAPVKSRFLYPCYGLESAKTTDVDLIKINKETDEGLAIYNSKIYPGDLTVVDLDNINFIGIKELEIKVKKHLNKSYPNSDSKNDRVKQTRKLLFMILQYIIRQCIPGGNPALASDMLRIVMIIISIERMLKGGQDRFSYTDHDTSKLLTLINQILQSGNSNLKELFWSRSPLKLIRTALSSPYTGKKTEMQSYKAANFSNEQTPFFSYSIRYHPSQDSGIAQYDIDNLIVERGSTNSNELKKIKTVFLAKLKQICFNFEKNVKSKHTETAEQQDERIDFSDYLAVPNENEYTSTRIPLIIQNMNTQKLPLVEAIRSVYATAINPSDSDDRGYTIPYERSATYHTTGTLLPEEVLVTLEEKENDNSLKRYETALRQYYPTTISDKPSQYYCIAAGLDDVYTHFTSVNSWFSSECQTIPELAKAVKRPASVDTLDIPVRLMDIDM